jgi:hypothetical protein
LSDVLDAALFYAQRGWRVFPCSGKQPITTHGVTDASTDESQIRAWWEKGDWNVAIATGPESGIFVIDVDPRNGGQLLEGVQAHVLTGGGGAHYYYKWPAMAQRLRSTYRPGVDVKGAGGYVLAPPSKTTGAYTYVQGGSFEPYDAPADMIVEIVKRIEEVRPGDKFNESDLTWAEMLEPHGWVVDHEKDGAQYWTRPGKDEGVSATTGYDYGEGPDRLYVFTSSTPFESQRGYDKFGAYAVLNHGGDLSAAAAALGTPSPRLSAASVPPPAGVAAVFPPSPVVAPAYSFTPAAPAGSFIDRYINYASLLTDCSLEYHEAAALTLLAIMTNQMKIELAPYPDGLSTNLYLVLVGESSNSRKSTAQGIAKNMIESLVPSVLLPDRMTGEAAIGALAMRSGQAAAWLPDEMGVTLQQIYERDFMRPLEELMLTLYSGQEYKYMTVGGLRHVYGLHLSIFGAATPESFSGAGARLTTGGLLPRFGIVFPGVRPPSRSLTNDSQKPLRDALMADLKSYLVIYNDANMIKKPIKVSKEALDYFAQEDRRFAGNPQTARLSAVVYKIGALVAMADGRQVILLEDAKAAVTVAVRLAQGAMRLRPYVARSVSDMTFEALINDVMLELRSAGMTGVLQSRSDIAKLLRLERRQLDRVRDTLSDRRLIAVQTFNGDETWLIP